MFQQSEDRIEKGRSRAIMIAAAVGALAIFAGVLIFGSFQRTPPEAPPPPTGLPNAVHAGNPVFDKNIGLVSLINKKFFTQANMLGQRQAIASGLMANFTDKPVLGVELRGKVLAKDGSVMATTLAMPVPKLYDKIPPKGNVPYTVTIDGLPAKGEIDDITIEIEGLVMGE